MLLSSIKAASRLQTGIASNIMTPSLIRAAEVLLPSHYLAFSSVSAESSGSKPSETSTPMPPGPKTIDTASKPTYFIQHHPLKSFIDHFNLWNTTPAGLSFERYAPNRSGMQIRQLLKDMNDLTHSRMDRWMLFPNIKFPGNDVFGDFLSLDVWKNAKFDEEKKVWSIPFQVPSIFNDGDITVNIVKDKIADKYMLRIQGKRREANTVDDVNDDSDVPPNTTEKPDGTLQKQNVGTSNSDYKYEMQFQLPPLPATDISIQEAQKYYSSIRAELNAHEGVLNIKIPERILSEKMVESQDHDDCVFPVKIESVA